MAKDVGSIRPWDPGYAERMRLALAAGLRKAGASNYRANDVSGRIFGLLDFVPGVDLAKGAVDTVDAYNAGDMTGAGIGAAATLLGVVPVVGDAAGKAVKKAAGKKAEKEVKGLLTDALQDDVPRPTYTGAQANTPVPKGAVEELFGTKHLEEERLRQEVLRQQEAQDAALGDGTADAGTRQSRSAEERAAREGRHWRNMYERDGADEVMRRASAGEHLRVSPSGDGFIGAPRHIGDQAGIESLRADLDGQLDLGVNAIREAEERAGTPRRVGTWYPRAKEFNWEINQPYQLNEWLQGTRVYSAGVAPESELAFNLKHWNSRALGEPGMAYRGAAMDKLDEWSAGGEVKYGDKIDEYGFKNDPRVFNDSPFGVNDFRMAQTFRYTNPDGTIWRGGASPQMHQFMDAETALMVGRANKRGAGGITDWRGETVQEVPWVAGKGQDLYRRLSKKFSGPDGKFNALREANNTAADYAPNHAMSVTYESMPGKDTGHRADLFDNPQAAAEYHRPWTDERGHDLMYKALGLRQLPTMESTGIYANRSGGVEYNPMSIARPLVDFQTVKPGIDTSTVADATMRSLVGAEGLRGLLTAQEAVAANLPVTKAARKAQQDMLIDTGGAQLSGAQLARLRELAQGQGFDVTPTGRGAMLMNFNEPDAEKAKAAGASAAARRQEIRDHLSNFQGPLQKGKKLPKRPAASGDRAAARAAEEANIRQQSNKVRARAMESVQDQVSDIAPGAALMPAGREGIYLPTFGPEQYTGKYTMKALERLAAMPDQASGRLLSDEGVRSKIMDVMRADAGLPTTRQDLQNTRAFLAANPRVDEAVRLIRAGMKPATALTLIGVSANTLADEEPVSSPAPEKRSRERSQRREQR